MLKLAGVIATTIPPRNDNEAAILAKLVPGNLHGNRPRQE